MQPNIQVIGGLERRIDLTIPATDIEAEVAMRLTKLARDVRMPGFRKGKVPLKLVASSYGAEVQSEVLNDKLGRAFNEAVNACNIRVAGQPQIEAKPDPVGSGFVFSATFEIYPEISFDWISSIEVKRAQCAVDDPAVDRTIEIMRKQRATFEPADRASVDGDRITIDFMGTIDGVPFDGGSATDYAVKVGGGSMLPEFDQALRGMKTGDKKTFAMNFPADYHGKEVAGKAAQFEVTAKKIEQPVLPAVDETFAKGIGIPDGDLTKMRAEIKANLEREIDTRLKARTRGAVLEALANAASFEIPKSLVANEAQRLSQEMLAQLAERGMDTKGVPLPLDLFAPKAERQVRLGLLVGELVRTENLGVQQQQLRQALEKVAQSYEKPAEVIQWYLQDRNRLSEIENSVLEDNVMAWVLTKAKVSDESVAFDELMGTVGL